MDLDKSTSTSTSLKKLQEDGALPGRGTAEREVGGTEPQPVLGRMVVIEDFILCGFLPPPSEFLLLVLNFYSLSLLHLNPNSIAFMSIFSHLCEAYIGVEPFLDLFRFYYELSWMEPKKVSGCVGFRLRDGLKSRYILFQCPSSRSKWRGRWFYLQIEDSDPVFIVPEEQLDKISSWTAKLALTPSLQSFIDIIDDLRVRGLSGYEVAADFIGLDSATVERRVGQLMITGPTTASNVQVPLCEKGAAERDVAINALPLTDIIGPLVDHQVAASLKKKVAKEVSDAVAAAATTSGGNVLKKGRKFSSVVGHRRKTPTPSPVSVAAFRRAAWAKAAQDGSGGTSSASPIVASTDVVVVPRSREATPSGPASNLATGRGLPAAILTWEELQVEMGCLLEAGARGISREIAEARAAAAASANERADRLAHDLAEVREDLQKMRELVAGNKRQRQGLEHRMSERENNLSEIRGSLRVTYTGLHQLAGECGIKSTIPANPDEFSPTTSLAELATAMEEIPSKHAARIGEETSNGIYTGACHVLACVRLAHPKLDLRKILDQGAASDARKDVMEEVGDLGESVLPLFEEDVDVEDVQQRGQPELPVIVPALAFEPHVPEGDVAQNSPVETSMATTPLDLESALADQDRRIQYWRTKFEVAELERTMLEVKKDQAVETLRGREVWFNSYLKSFCTSMSRVCRELRVPRGDPEKSATGYIPWLNGACAQLEGISQRIDEALKQECRRSSQYAGGMYWPVYEIIVRSCTSSSSMKGFLVLGELLRR
uniref:Retrotransposon protein, putative, unclassified n=1 Tax=Oryza sativa subsp. japonica TaxID=39947 RepID=Q10LG2_ORYSJ|nr:retrotransposon protein, putative, unclassified [Oryza sativa Japonica Group]